MANTYLSRTTGTPTNAKKFTISGWFKIQSNDTSDHQFFQHYTDGNNREHMYFSSGNKLRFYCVDSGSTAVYLDTKRKFRDANAWYHIVIAADTTQSTASNRVKIYVNGVQETEFDTATYPAQDFNFKINSNSKSIVIGRYMGSDDYYYDGLISHYHFIDGTQYAASTFGSTDSTTGEWKINTAPSVTYGNNGWFIFKDNASVTDQSGEGNNWTVTAGSVTPTQDNPSNIFCTLNPLATGNSKPTFSKGANRVVGTATSYQFSCGTIAVPLTGKWYWEVKANNNVNGSNSEYLIGAVLESRLEASGNFAEFAADGITQYGSVGTGIAQNDIIGVSVDRTAATLKIYKNNSLILTKSSLPAELLYPLVTVYGSGIGADANFGNGYFGGSAVSSAGTNASNNGIFEYDVIPSDANALSTKGLNL